MSADFQFPPSIDPAMPVGQLTLEQITSLYAAATFDQRAANGRKISAARMACLSPERRREIARTAARARWDKKAG